MEQKGTQMAASRLSEFEGQNYRGGAVPFDNCSLNAAAVRGRKEVHWGGAGWPRPNGRIHQNSLSTDVARMVGATFEPERHELMPVTHTQSLRATEGVWPVQTQTPVVLPPSESPAPSSK